MITQIQLGSFFNENGRTILTGGASNLDIESIVNGLADAKKLPATNLQTKIDANAEISSALSTFKTKLKTLQDAANFMRNPPGVGQSTNNVFEYRTSGIAASDGSAGGNYLSMTTEPGASVGQFKIAIDHLATGNNYTTATFALATADTAAVGGTGPLNAGTLALGVGGVPITLTAGDTLNQVAAKINAVKDQSGVEASVIKVANGSYRLSFKSTATGADQNYNIVGMNAGRFNVGFAVLSDAVDAEISFDGTTINRPTNSIDDVVEGVTLNLLQKTPPTVELTTTIKPDQELVKQGILNFVSAYNDLKQFVAIETARDGNGTPLETAHLTNNSTVSLGMSALTSEISRVVSGLTSGDYNKLSDLGIKFTDSAGDDTADPPVPPISNVLTIDEDKLASAIASNFEQVRNVFEFDSISDNADLQVFSRTNDLNVTNLTVNVNKTTGIYTATYGTTTVNLVSRVLSDGSVTLTGPDGSSIKGLLMIYAGSAPTATVHVSMSQGIADRAFNMLDNYTKKTTGTIDVAITSITNTDKRYEEEISKINDQVTVYRDQLLTKYAQLERAISAANTLLQSLDAQANARNNS